MTPKGAGRRVDGMTAYGPEQTFRLASLTSAFGVRADMTNADRHFRF